MNVMSVYYSYRDPTEKFLKFSSYFTHPRHSQITKMDATTVLFMELPDLQLHYHPMFDSLYIIGTCHFRLYFFACRDFVVPLFHPLFDPVALYIAIFLQMAHPAPSAAPPAPSSPPPVVPSLSSESDPLEDAASPLHPLLLATVMFRPTQAWRMGFYIQNPFRWRLHLADCSV